MDPREFLQLAHTLAATDGAAGYRTVISRAYSAVYNVAFDFLLVLGFNVGHGHSAHEAVRVRLLNSGVASVSHRG